MQYTGIDDVGLGERKRGRTGVCSKRFVVGVRKEGISKWLLALDHGRWLDGFLQNLQV